MKWIKTLLAVFVAVALTSTPMWAGEKVIYDNDGNRWVVDTETAGTPGAGSGLGALVGAVDDTLDSFQKHKFDLQLGLTAAGVAGDDSSKTETALTGLTLYYRPDGWVRLGAGFTWNTIDRSAFTFSLPIGFKLFPNPWGSVNFWLDTNLLPTYTVRTGETDIVRESAFSWVPSAQFAVEVPMDMWSVEAGIGAGIPVSIEGVTESDVNNAVDKVAAAVQFAINLRMGR